MRIHTASCVISVLLGASACAAPPAPGDACVGMSCVDVVPSDASTVDSIHDALVTTDTFAIDTIQATDSSDAVDVSMHCDCSGSCVTRACASACGHTDGGYCPVTHVFDLATHMPARLTMMFSMSWFGIPRTGDPNGPGSDRGWGNWRWGGGCVAVNDPTSCGSYSGSSQRQVASRHRPLAGLYSSTGRDDESLRRIDLMLSTLRRPCDDGARIDSWSVQLDSIRFTSRYLQETDHNFAQAADIAYRAFVAFLARADTQGLANVIAPGIDSTWYWHFGGLTTQADKLQALEDDLVDMLEISAPHASTLRIGSRPIVYAYTGGTATAPYISVSEWTTLLGHVRDRTGLDAYVIGGTTDPSYFAAFDAISPWIELGTWNATSGATTYDHAVSWTHRRMDRLVNGLATYPGRVVWGGVTPGFDDYTHDWGVCDVDRVIPRVDALLDGQFDVMTSYRTAGHAIGGMLFATWDDWTEGSVFEPEVGEGAGRLVHLRQRLGQYFSDPVDTAGDARLTARWTSYGEARNCAGGALTLAPPIDLHCP